jgi:hypothetical protein
MKKKRSNRLKYLKKYLVRFDFISLKLKNFNRTKLVWLKINRTKPNFKKKKTNQNQARQNLKKTI